jgi:hypothetical protein
LLERTQREIGRRTRVVGTFPDGHSIAAKLRHIAGSAWSSKRYLGRAVVSFFFTDPQLTDFQGGTRF